MKSETLSLKTIIKEFNLWKKTVLFNETVEEKKDLSLLGDKLTEKIPDPRNAEEKYQSSIRKKNRISEKQ